MTMQSSRTAQWNRYSGLTSSERGAAYEALRSLSHRELVSRFIASAWSGGSAARSGRVTVGHGAARLGSRSAVLQATPQEGREGEPPVQPPPARPAASSRS